MDNKQVFANNLNRLMKENGKSRREVCEATDINYNTFTDWCNGRKYPRMNKVEKLADYFGVLISDLVEDKPVEHLEMKQKNDTLTDVVKRMRTDEVFSEAVLSLYSMDAEKLKGLLALLK